MSVRPTCINNGLRTNLQQKRQLQNQEERRQVFSDVARRYAKSNGFSIDLKDSPGRMTDASRLGTHTSLCNGTVLHPYNVRYSIQRSHYSRNWKVWVAVDADFDFSSSAIDGDELLPEMIASQDPILCAVVFWTNQKLMEACKGTDRHTKVGTSRVEVPENVELQLLYWDTVIALKLNTCTQVIRMNWMGQIGEMQPARSETIVLPITRLLALFDI